MNKKDVVDKTTLEQYYSKARKIKFNDANFKPENIKDIFYRLISLKEDNSTVYSKNGFHCYSGRNRSIDDFIKLCKNYFPNVSVKEILKTLENHLNDEIDEGISYHKYRIVAYCPNIKKNNFWRSSYTSSKNVEYFKNISFNNNGFLNTQLKIKDIIEETN